MAKAGGCGKQLQSGCRAEKMLVFRTKVILCQWIDLSWGSSYESKQDNSGTEQ